METYILENGRRSDNPIKRQIGDLIGKIGSPHFEPSFFRIVREATACEHVTAFASSDRAPARLLFALNRGAKPVARSDRRKISHALLASRSGKPPVRPQSRAEL